MTEQPHIFKKILRENPGYGFLLAFVLYLLLQMVLVGFVAPLLGNLYGLDSDTVVAIFSGDLSVSEHSHHFFRLVQFLHHEMTRGLVAILMASWLGSVKDSLSLRAPKPAWLPALAIGTMVVSIPFVQWTYLPETVLELPERFSDLEEMMKSQEQLGQETLMALFSVKGAVPLLLNLLVFALAPAVCEELFFRGYMLGHARTKWNVHLSVWVIAIIFSFIHLQALGFFSRLLLGGFLGYFVVYGGSLYSSIAAHFVFNGTAILAQAFVDPADVESIAAEADKPVWYFALISAVLTAFLLNRYRQSAEEATPDSPL